MVENNKMWGLNKHYTHKHMYSHNIKATDKVKWITMITSIQWQLMGYIR